jgi:pimeloyl-ACP methyl ester carboxylesterase
MIDIKFSHMKLSTGDIAAGLVRVGGARVLFGLSRELVDMSLEFAQLATDPVFFGCGVPRGDGHPVMVVPGFLASDTYLLTIRGWLRRIGYEPVASGLKRNTGELGPLIELVADRVEAAVREHGARASLVGHSLGGVIARAVARRNPAAVRQVITLGSPLGLDPAPLHPSIRVTAIYSRSDRIVRYPRALDPAAAANLEVTGSHCGMAFKAAVYRALGELLPDQRPS